MMFIEHFHFDRNNILYTELQNLRKIMQRGGGKGVHARPILGT